MTDYHVRLHHALLRDFDLESETSLAISGTKGQTGPASAFVTKITVAQKYSLQSDSSDKFSANDNKSLDLFDSM